LKVKIIPEVPEQRGTYSRYISTAVNVTHISQLDNSKNPSD
jgi:hypothetical protein